MQQKSFIIGVCGGSGSGKTTFAQRLQTMFDNSGYISQDNYYFDQSSLTEEEVKEFNFDHPESIDLELLRSDLVKHKTGAEIEIPRYCFETHARLDEKELVQACGVTIVEGIHIFNNKSLRDVFDLKVFLDLDSDLRFLRRLKRDTVERGRTFESVVEQYEKTTRPMYKVHVDSVKKYCDMIFDAEVDIEYSEYMFAVKKNVGF